MENGIVINSFKYRSWHCHQLIQIRELESSTTKTSIMLLCPVRSIAAFLRSRGSQLSLLLSCTVQEVNDYSISLSSGVVVYTEQDSASSNPPLKCSWTLSDRALSDKYSSLLLWFGLLEYNQTPRCRSSEIYITSCYSWIGSRVFITANAKMNNCRQKTSNQMRPQVPQQTKWTRLSRILPKTNTDTDRQPQCKGDTRHHLHTQTNFQYQWLLFVMHHWTHCSIDQLFLSISDHM